MSLRPFRIPNAAGRPRAAKVDDLIATRAESEALAIARNQVAALERSLRRHDQQKPLILSEDQTQVVEEFPGALAAWNRVRREQQELLETWRSQYEMLRRKLVRSAQARLTAHEKKEREAAAESRRREALSPDDPLRRCPECGLHKHYRSARCGRCENRSRHAKIAHLFSCPVCHQPKQRVAKLCRACDLARRAGQLPPGGGA